MRILAFIAAFATLTPGAAFAQSGHQSERQPEHQSKRQTEQTQASKPDHNKPDRNKGQQQSGQRDKVRHDNRKVSHAEKCRRKYASYNPRTDRYTVRRGVTRPCRL